MKGIQDRHPLIQNIRDGKNTTKSLNLIGKELGSKLSIQEGQLLNLAVDGLLAAVVADLVSKNFITEDGLKQLFKGVSV